MSSSLMDFIVLLAMPRISFLSVSMDRHWLVFAHLPCQSGLDLQRWLIAMGNPFDPVAVAFLLLVVCKK